MAKCININHPDYIDLLQESGLHEDVLKAKISIWMEENGEDRIPALEELAISPLMPVTQERLNQVQELFESNPELANAVYEALGFKEKLSSITPKVSITNYRTMDDKSKKDAIDGVEEAQRRWVEEEIAEFYEAVHQYNNNLDTFSSKGVNKGKATIDDVIDETLGIFRTIQMFPKFSDLILPYIDDIQIAIDSFGRKEGYAIYKAKKDKKGQAKEMTYENLFEVVDKYMKPFQITPQQKQQAQQLYSQYLEQNPNGSIEQFKSWVEEFNRKTNIQGAYDFGASSNSGKWNSANNELLSLVQDNRKAFAIYKFLIGDMETFKEIVDFLNERGIEIPYTDRMKRADETMTAEERKSAIDSYNNSVTSKVEDKVQVEKDILSENNLQDETEYTPQELIEKYPLTGVQKVIWNLIKDVVNKLGIKVKFSSSRITEGFDGSNNPQNGEILIRPSTLKNGRFGEVLVHEVVHALTTKIISRVNSGVTTGLTQKQINAVKGLMKLFEAVKADNNLENKYPVKDVFEFIAHLTNEEFVKELESKDKNFLQKVVDFILDIFGITNANELAKKYLLDIISDGVFLQENGITVLPSDYGSNLQGSLSDFITQKSQERLNQIKDVFNENPELNRIGTIQQYASYLDTIFPDSKVKDIVVHGAGADFEKFDKSFYSSGDPDYIYFGIKGKPGFKSFAKRTVYALVNIKNPNKFIDNTSEKVENPDGFVEDYTSEFFNNLTEDQEYGGEFLTQIGVKEPEQIHILGSKKDIEKFKNWIGINNVLPSQKLLDNLQFKKGDC